jgi:hypothetical protein
VSIAAISPVHFGGHVWSITLMLVGGISQR